MKGSINKVRSGSVTTDVRETPLVIFWGYAGLDSPSRNSFLDRIALRGASISPICALLLKNAGERVELAKRLH